MKLSVLIVSYNIRYFLEHCLLSVIRAAENMEAAKGWQTEVLVIDNASIDDTVRQLRPSFPTIRFIEAGSNLGFGKANNQLINLARGDYFLYLNPDTLVAADCFLTTVDFMESHPHAGACGVRMIDGSGSYLPESKRGFPGGWNSFTKMTGLAKLFPTSRVFAGYYEGHLQEKEISEVAILSGAWMMAKAEVVKRAGGFDERFFMYAEDIDLSYRIAQLGYKNYYLTTTTIIHFKGESTRKDKEYAQRFYSAMILFVDKHFSGISAAVYKLLLRGIIAFRGAVTGSQKEGLPAHGSLKKQVAGDPDAISALRGIIPAKLAAPGEMAAEIVYCIGEQFSIDDLISAIETESVLLKRIFHPRASAIIGSDSKNAQGSIELLVQ